MSPRPTEAITGVLIAAVVIGCIIWGWYLAFDYDESAPVDQPGIELDIDRAKPRPPLKQDNPKQPAAPAPKRVK